MPILSYHVKSTVMAMFPRSCRAALCVALTLALPTLSLAGENEASASARYIRTLFDATLLSSSVRVEFCSDISAIGHFGAGRLWRQLDATERDRFEVSFCALAMATLSRLRLKFPNLTLLTGESVPAAPGLMRVRSIVAQGAATWPVDWLVGRSGAGLYLADLRVAGISLGILLRSMAISGPAGARPQAPEAALVLLPWRQMLDRMLPAAAGSAP